MKPVWAVAAKELLDLARDRRAVVLGFVLPVLAVPAMSLVVEASTTRRLHGPARVAVVGMEHAQSLLRHAEGLLELVTVPSPDEALRAGRVAAVLEVPQDLDAQAERGGAELVLRYRSQDPEGLLAREKVAQVVARYSLPLVDRRLHAGGLDRSVLTPVRLRESEIPGGGGWTSLALPLLAVVWSFAGASLVAADLTAGERERGTWDALRGAPVGRLSLVGGKFTACWAAGTALASLGVGAQLAFSRAWPVGWAQGAGLLAAAASASAVAAAAALVVGLLSKSAREANQWALPLYLVALAAASGGDAARGWSPAAYVPVLNAFLLAQQAAQTSPELGRAVATVASSALWACALTVVAAGLVDRD